jgi:hypothetical protein
MDVQEQFIFVGPPFLVNPEPPEDPLAIIVPPSNQTAIEALENLLEAKEQLEEGMDLMGASSSVIGAGIVIAN